MKKKILPWIITLSALSVSGSAAFYSISGLGKMFAGASTQVMVLAGSLEFAKLVTASLLFDYWKKLNKLLRSYLLAATLILILITSAGIYGFLSSAYQETAFKVQNQDKNVELLDNNIKIIKTEITNYESNLKQKNARSTQLTTIRASLQSTQDALIAKSRSTAAINQQIKSIESEIKRLDTEIQVINDSISSKNTLITKIETDKLGVSSNSDLAKEVGPLKYIASLTGKSLDSVVNWYIIVLMIVFDPLAIALVVAANFAFSLAKEDDTEGPKNNGGEEPITQDPGDSLLDLQNNTEEKEEEISNSQEEENKFEIKQFGEDNSNTMSISDFTKNDSVNDQEKEEKEDKYKKDYGGYKVKPKVAHQAPQGPLSLK